MQNFIVRRGNSTANRTIWVDDVVLEEITGVNVYSTDGGYFTLSKTTGNVVTDYLNLNKCHATGGAQFYAGSHSVDGLDNTGWTFSDPPPAGLGWLALVNNRHATGSPLSGVIQ